MYHVLQLEAHLLCLAVYRREVVTDLMREREKKVHKPKPACFIRKSFRDTELVCEFLLTLPGFNECATYLGTFFS